MSLRRADGEWLLIASFRVGGETEAMLPAKRSRKTDVPAKAVAKPKAKGMGRQTSLRQLMKSLSE